MKKINEEKFRKEIRRRLKLIKEQQLSQGALDVIGQSRSAAEGATADSTFTVPEGMSSTELAEKAAFSFPSESAKQEAISKIEKEIESMKKGPVTLTKAQAADFAVRIHDATIGSTGAERITRMVGIGLGTDKGAIKDVFSSGVNTETGAREGTGIPTCVDVSYVSKQFEEMYAGAWSFTPTLNAVLSSELDDEDFNINVGIPLSTKKETAFVKIGDSVLGEDQFYELISMGAELQKLEGEQRSGLMAGSGLVTSLAVVTGNYDPTFTPGEGTNPPGDSADPSTYGAGFVDFAAVSASTVAAFLGHIKDLPVIDAATGKPIPGAQAAKMRGKERLLADWEVFKSGYKGNASARHAAKVAFEKKYLATYMEVFDEAVARGAPVTDATGRPARGATGRKRVSDAAAKAARETFDEAWNQTSRGWLRSTAAATDDVVKIAARRGVNREAAKRAAGEAAEKVIKGSLLKLGVGGTARGAAKLGLRAVPYVGWALLANDLAQWMFNANIDPDSDMIMNSEFHERIKTLYTGFESRQQKTLDELKSVPVITKAADCA